MIIKNFRKQKGFTLLELLMYISGLLIIGSVLIILLVNFYSLYKEIVAAPRADRTGLLIIDRITKEIRSANQIDTLKSEFEVTEGVLTLDTDQGGTVVEKKFYVEGGVAKYQEGSDEPMILSPKGLTVSNFNFDHIQTPVSEAVRFTMELEYQARHATSSKSYTGFAILRESYE